MVLTQEREKKRETPADSGATGNEGGKEGPKNERSSASEARNSAPDMGMDFPPWSGKGKRKGSTLQAYLWTKSRTGENNFLQRNVGSRPPIFLNQAYLHQKH